jgi:hypothetical protein
MACPLLYSRFVRTGVAVLIVLVSTATAVADNRDEPKSDRYAEQIIATDVAAIGLAVGGHEAGQEALRDVGMGIGVAGAPLIHLANGNYRGAAGSLALRITLPLAAAVLGDELAPDDTATGRIKTGHVLGMAVGLMAVSVIDATTLAKKPAKTRERSIVRDARPDLVFKNGGVRFVVMTKF